MLLPDATDWQVYEAGSVFNVPVTASFICKLPNPPLICAATVIPRLPLEREGIFLKCPLFTHNNISFAGIFSISDIFIIHKVDINISEDLQILLQNWRR